MSEIFAVDGEPTTREAFEARLEALTEVPGTWFCDETDEGGDAGYDATDADGCRWTYVAETGSSGTRSSLRKVEA